MFNFIFPTVNLKIEKWKWNKEYQVFVSNMGHIRNKNKQLVPIKISQGGYCSVWTSCGLKTVHRLVMLTWKPIPNAENLTVDHLDHNKRNNSIFNLEWVSRIENQKRASADFIITEDDKEKNKLKNEIFFLKKKIKEIENKNFIITTGSNIFSNVEEAAAWLIKKQKMQKNVLQSNVEKKIINSISTKELYCGYLWKIIFN